MEDARLLLLDESGVRCGACPRWVRVRPLLTIGRAPDNDFVIADSAVSGHHLTVATDAGGWVLVDRGSCNGTLVRRQRIEGSRRLRDGDEIHIGRSRLLFEPSWQIGGRGASDATPRSQAPTPAQSAARLRDLYDAFAQSPPESVDQLIALWCAELLPSVPIKRAALFLPAEGEQLAPRASWRWPLAQLAPMGRHTLRSLTGGTIEPLVWNEPGSATGRPARVHLLCVLPLEDGAADDRLWHYRTAPHRRRELGAIWLECRRVDAEHRRIVEQAAGLIPAQVRALATRQA